MTKDHAPKQPLIPEPTAEERSYLKSMSGSDDHVFAACLVARTVGTSRWDPSPDAGAALASATRTAMEALAPKDAVEGLLVAQAVGLHNGAMRCLHLAVMPRQTMDGAARCWRDAASLSRAMLDTVQALDQYRHRSEIPARV